MSLHKQSQNKPGFFDVVVVVVAFNVFVSTFVAAFVVVVVKAMR